MEAAGDPIRHRPAIADEVIETRLHSMPMASRKFSGVTRPATVGTRARRPNNQLTARVCCGA
jgi:hypothetical protein